MLKSLSALEGHDQPNTAFGIVPLLTTPRDLYAVAVLAVQSFLAGGDWTLAVALDKLWSLGTQVGAERAAAPGRGARPDAAGPPTGGLRAQVAALFAKEPRWAEWLGPHRLRIETMRPQEAFEVVPPSLWWDLLAMILRMFPGSGPESPCRDLGDVPEGAIHKVFDRACGDAESLLLRTRALVLGDWRRNQEIDSLLRRCQAAVQAPPARQPPAQPFRT